MRVAAWLQARTLAVHCKRYQCEAAWGRGLTCAGTMRWHSTAMRTSSKEMPTCAGNEQRRWNDAMDSSKTTSHAHVVKGDANLPGGGQGAAAEHEHVSR